MLSPDEAAALTGVGARTIYRWVEAGLVHFAETAEGSLLICLNSLPSSRPAQYEPKPARGEPDASAYSASQEEVNQLRLEVFSLAGEKVFDSGFGSAQVIDLDPEEERNEISHREQR